MKFELIDPPGGSESDTPAPEADRPSNGPSAPKVPHIGPVEGDLGRVRLTRAVEQVRAVVEDLRARAAERSMAESRLDETALAEPGDEFNPLRFRARTHPQRGGDAVTGSEGGVR